ncbi:MAG: FAD:protein FMN transferase [Firmicutes bacterium]|nr:FAD:protein FMN transferase [Bacillota bacterium]
MRNRFPLYRVILYAVVAVTVILVLFSGRLQEKRQTETITEAFDTVSQITVFSRTKKPLTDAKKYLIRLDSLFSAYDENSEIYKLNHYEDIDVSKETAEILDFAKKFTDENSEYYSVYVNPLVEAWDIKNNTGHIPDVTKPLAEVKEKKSINLGSVAKGYAAEKIAEILKKDGVKSAMINLGGNAYAVGTKPNGEKWKVGIQDPKDEDSVIGVITAENLAVVTSGDYQRFFELDGVRYHHIFDLKTGYPVNNGLHSVTIISSDSMIADALSTAVFAAGVEKGTELLKKYNAEGILITDDTIYFSKSLENIFKQSTFKYKYEFIY